MIWTPPAGRTFSVGSHDIWRDPHSATNAAEMDWLETRRGAWCDWQGFWPKAYLEAMAEAHAPA